MPAAEQESSDLHGPYQGPFKPKIPGAKAGPMLFTVSYLQNVHVTRHATPLVITSRAVQKQTVMHADTANFSGIRRCRAYDRRCHNGSRS